MSMRMQRFDVIIRVRLTKEAWEEKGVTLYFFYVYFPIRDARDAARRVFGARCINCGDNTHFTRECPQPFTNISSL